MIIREKCSIKIHKITLQLGKWSNRSPKLSHSMSPTKQQRLSESIMCEALWTCRQLWWGAPADSNLSVSVQISLIYARQPIYWLAGNATWVYQYWTKPLVFACWAISSRSISYQKPSRSLNHSAKGHGIVSTRLRSRSVSDTLTLDLILIRVLRQGRNKAHCELRSSCLQTPTTVTRRGKHIRSILFFSLLVDI